MSIPYLEQAKLGRARWFDFVFGAFFILLGWIVTQLIFGMPIVDIASDLGIELSDTEAQARTQAFIEDNPLTAVGSLVAILGVLLACICYLVSRTTHNTLSRVMGVIAMVGVALTIAGVVMLLPLLGIASEGEDPTLAVLGQSALAYGLVLFSFVGAILAAWLVQRFIHYRTFTSLITAAARIRWSRIIWTVALTWGVYAASVFIMGLFTDGGIYPNPDRPSMLPFVIATLLFIPIQCAAEEVMFRGYLNQALGRFIPSALAVFIVTSIAFGALHLANPEIGAAKDAGMFWLVFAGYCLFGFILSLMVWVDNGLESAIGVHIGNNAWIAIFLNYEGSVLPVPGMFLQPSEPGTDTVFGLITLGVLLLCVWLTRKPLASRNPVVTEAVPAELVS